MLTPMTTAGIFLVRTLFDFVIFMGLLRTIMQFNQVDFYNPFTQGVIKLTEPLVKWLRYVSPRFKRFDGAVLIALFIAELLKFMLLAILQGIFVSNFAGLLVLAVADLLRQLTGLYFYIIIGWVLLSWVSPFANHPVAIVLFQLVEPLLRPIRRCLPTLVGFDLSPLVVIILIKLVDILLVTPTMTVALKLMMS